MLADDGGGFGAGLVTGFGAGRLEFPADLTSAADTTTFAVSLLVGNVCCGAATMLGDDGTGFGGRCESGFATGGLEFPADLTSAADTTTFAVSLLVGKVC